MNLTARALEHKLYARECETHPTKIQYYIVTNPTRAVALLQELQRDKQAQLDTYQNAHTSVRGQRRKLEERFQLVLGRVKEGGRVSDKVQHEELGRNRRYGGVDLISIPARDAEISQASLLEKLATANIFCAFPASNQDNTEPEVTITATDLAYMYQRGSSSVLGAPALVPATNLFLERRGGTEFQATKELLSARELDKALTLLRREAEHVMTTWLRWHDAGYAAAKMRKYGQGDAFDHAARAGIITESDRVQGKAVKFPANASMHHDILEYHWLNGVLLLNWLEDFTDRTLGAHRVTKSRVNGTDVSDQYLLVKDEQEYRLHRALFDHLQAINRKERADTVLFERVECGGGTYQKRAVMRAALDVFEEVKPRVKFNASERMFAEAMNAWAKMHEPVAHRYSTEDEKLLNLYTGSDAKRAAFFAYHLFYRSKEVDPNVISSRGFKDELDTYLLTVIKKKGMPTRRHEQYNLQELEPQLEEQLRIVESVSKHHFGELLDGSTHRQPWDSTL